MMLRRSKLPAPFDDIAPDHTIKYMGFIEVPKDKAALFEQKVQAEFPFVSLSIIKEWTWIRTPEGNGHADVEMGEFLKEKSRKHFTAPSP